jgi:membrane associated rhomboid family serine protease
MIPIGDDVTGHRRFALVTLALILVNVLVFLWQESQGSGFQRVVQAFGTVPYEITHGDDIGPPGPQPIYLTLLTSMFMHANWMHLGGNMLFLWVFGDNLEDRMGPARFILFYLLCGLAASAAQIMLNPDGRIPGIGASGAIAGVMGAYLVLYPHSRVLMLFPFPVFLFELPAVVFLAIWFVVQFLNGINQLPVFERDAISGGVAFWAHVMGFVSGLILVVFLKRPERTRVEWWDTIES